MHKVAEKAPKAAAKSTSNYFPAPHSGPTPLCGLEIPGSPSIRLSAVIGSSHALSRARGCRSRSAAHFFVRNDMGNPLLRRDHAPAAKKQMGVDPARGILVNLLAIWHEPEFGAATFSECGRALRIELFALEAPSRHT